MLRFVLSAIDQRDLVKLAGAAAGQMAVAAASTLAIARLFDELLLGAEASDAAMTTTAAVLVCLAVATLLLRRTERTLAERCGQEFAHRTRFLLWDHLHDLPANVVINERRGAVVLRFLGDLTALRALVTRGFVAGGIALGTVLGALVALLFLHRQIGLAALISLALAASLQAQFGGALRTSLVALRKARTRLATDVMERVTTINVVQAFGQRRRERRRLVRKSRRLVQQSLAYSRISGTHQGIGEAATLLTIVVVLLVAWWAHGTSNPPSAGTLAACLLLTRLLGRPARTLSRVHEVWHRAAVAYRKIAQFLALPAVLHAPAGARKLRPGGGRVRFRDVTVRGAIHQVSAAASAGSLVRIEGANGSGKSTLLRVLSGLTRPDSGRVVVDGRDLSLCKLDSLRRQIGVVSPDLPLLRGTIRRNLTYRHPGASEAEVRELVAQLDLEGFLERCEQGLDSRVSEGGANLSAGQRQKIALGRALLGCPRILILDEPDVHLDAAGLRVLHSVIDSFAGTIFLVWHGADPPGADLVWTLRQGRLVRRRGTPAEEPARVVDLRGALRPISRSSEPLPPSDSVVEAVPARGR